MLVDIFADLEKSTRHIGKILADIMRKQHQSPELDLLPEELLLHNALYIYQETGRYMQPRANVFYRRINEAEFNKIINRIYDDSRFLEMKDKFTSNSMLNSSVKGIREFYWDRFNYVGNDKDLSWRVALNVLPQQELFDKIDEFAKKHGIFYKYVNMAAEYNRRRDPFVLYFSDKHDKKQIINELETIIKPYIRRDKYNILGYENLQNGMYTASEDYMSRAMPRLQKLLGEKCLRYITSGDSIATQQERIKSIENPLDRALISYMTGKMSAGRYAVIELFLDAFIAARRKETVYTSADKSVVRKTGAKVVKKMFDGNVVAAEYDEKEQRISFNIINDKAKDNPQTHGYYYLQDNHKELYNAQDILMKKSYYLCNDDDVELYIEDYYREDGKTLNYKNSFLVNEYSGEKQFTGTDYYLSDGKTILYHRSMFDGKIIKKDTLQLKKANDVARNKEIMQRTLLLNRRQRKK